MNLIEAKNMSFTYPDGSKALQDVSLEVKKGEFVGLLASNGSGKTTLLRCINGLIKPQSGEVMVDGAPVSRLSQKTLFQRVGMVFQNPNDQLFASTVSEDVAFGPSNMGLQKDKVRSRVEDSLKAVGMEGLGRKSIHNLSFGQQKRVCIAGALAMHPEVLLLDEPTAGLDPMGEHKIMELLQKLNNERGLTIIMATHMVDMVPLFIDRIYILSRGKVLREGTPEKIFSDQEMIRDAKLRLPMIAELIELMKREDGIHFDRTPLTIGEARRELVKMIPLRELKKQ
ncbi:MAG: ATP-binding cassette domain-containing protein [Deltaproteobacteria bacterium]|nr:ATP-binding cassette domain-containing protein [Deltaproteobacteria bacterium]